VKTGTGRDANGNVYDLCLFDRDFMDDRQTIAYALVEKVSVAPTANGFIAAEFASSHFSTIVWGDETTLAIQPWINGMEGTDTAGNTWVTFMASFKRRCHVCGDEIDTGWHLFGSGGEGDRWNGVWVCRHHFDVEGKH
jgi:hypothetical protein